MPFIPINLGSNKNSESSQTHFSSSLILWAFLDIPHCLNNAHSVLQHLQESALQTRVSGTVFNKMSKPVRLPSYPLKHNVYQMQLFCVPCLSWISHPLTALPCPKDLWEEVRHPLGISTLLSASSTLRELETGLWAVFWLKQNNPVPSGNSPRVPAPAAVRLTL